MSTNDILYLIVIAFFALGIAAYQYFYKAKTTLKKRVVFAFLRFLSLFLLGVLLLNPSFKQRTIIREKPHLVVAVDNSKSIDILGQATNTRGFLETLRSSKLSDKFTINYFSFDSEAHHLKDSLSFKGLQTNVSKVFPALKNIYENGQTPTILVSDGNQTFGQDYVLTSLTYKQPIYPVIIGDTILKEDLKISNIQLNKYTFLKNEFPVEITLDYVGQNTVNKDLDVYQGDTKVYSKQLVFSKDNTTNVIQFNLPALSNGKQNYNAKISVISGEENTLNNNRSFSIDVIDERTNVLLISDILHPDIGAYKKAIETHQQRKVTVVKPSKHIDFNNYELVILFQPTRQFTTVFKQLEALDKNHLIITGLHTDWAFLNNQKPIYKRTILNESQDFTGQLNPDFELFQQDDFQINTFPPLEDLYGTLEFRSNANVLLQQRINGVETEEPIFVFFENENRREALFLGEGIWRWRAQSYLNTQSFEVFDKFIGKTIQYLASNTKKERLTIDASDEFLLGEAKINAQYVDQNYVIDSNATLLCQLTHQETRTIYNYNFLFNNNSYKLELSNLSSGTYTYRVNVKDSKLTKSGQFIINNFDIEAQFINPDVTKLSQLATNNQNKLYTINQGEQLIMDLITDDQFKAVQKETINKLPLINWKYLLAVLLVLLTFEWLLRKYNGLL
jgi:hypothetical protein